MKSPSEKDGQAEGRKRQRGRPPAWLAKFGPPSRRGRPPGSRVTPNLPDEGPPPLFASTLALPPRVAHPRGGLLASKRP